MQLIVRWLLAPLVRLIYRPVVNGAERIPKTGPVILAANHLSAIDTAAIALTATRPVAFLGKAEYFTGTGLKGRALAAFLRALGYIPVDRANAKAGLAAIAAAMEVLQEGRVFAIYPEGTRSLDGRLHRGHTGVATLALRSGAPVVPVALHGTDEVLPKGALIPRLRPVTVTFGEPLDFSRYDGLEASNVIRRAVTDEIMDAIAQLSHQEYVDRYHERPAA
ncbi:1-acyl-sn-glycerol-3-phosphate acyltransferase [Pseudonocardia thermophila]|uniref:1-acyl-sn-glycerol-3-phosphate acyltransferase n=1 Tax=Pseudonocardia thermophila TaxID=1848 RepID=A0A1M6VKN3_PSETH|nr:lysophospholipid acyltransferase family protein [Pseudonocardia thermophila]SHK81796.1 1-acyl-sn-glycerol-3-phosphate acyltransferase [Pseudonocardia thermophila]